VSPRRGPGRAGHTLVEFALAVVVLLVIGVPIAGIYTTGQSASRDVEASSAALLLARELLEEASARAFEEPGTSGSFGRETGEDPVDRTRWDDVDDYDGYAPGLLLDIEGQPISGFPGFTRSVAVENVADTDFGSVRPAGATNFKRIVVTVASTSPGASDVRLETVVGRK
jgi:hypothetical protein